MGGSNAARHDEITDFVRAIDPGGVLDDFEVQVILREFKIKLTMRRCVEPVTKDASFFCVVPEELEHQNYDHNAFSVSLLDASRDGRAVILFEERGKGGLSNRDPFLYRNETGGDTNLIGIEIRVRRKEGAFEGP